MCRQRRIISASIYSYFVILLYSFVTHENMQIVHTRSVFNRPPKHPSKRHSSYPNHKEKKIIKYILKTKIKEVAQPSIMVNLEVAKPLPMAIECCLPTPRSAIGPPNDLGVVSITSICHLGVVELPLWPWGWFGHPLIDQMKWFKPHPRLPKGGGRAIRWQNRGHSTTLKSFGNDFYYPHLLFGAAEPLPTVVEVVQPPPKLTRLGGRATPLIK